MKVKGLSCKSCLQEYVDIEVNFNSRRASNYPNIKFVRNHKDLKTSDYEYVPALITLHSKLERTTLRIPPNFPNIYDATKTNELGDAPRIGVDALTRGTMVVVGFCVKLWEIDTKSIEIPTMLKPGEVGVKYELFGIWIIGEDLDYSSPKRTKMAPTDNFDV